MYKSFIHVSRFNGFLETAVYAGSSDDAGVLHKKGRDRFLQ